MTNYANIRYQPAAASTTTVANMAALIALTGMSNGDQALVQATNKLYMYSGTGWYLIATIQNDAPSAITGVNGTYELAIDGTVTTITAASTDPEGFPLTWSYSTSGLGSIATVSNVDNVFTITPSTTEADAGTFTLTINATDGINGAVSTSTNLSLNFIVTVTNSKYTTLLVTATDTSDNNNITDTSTNNHTITVNGDAYAGTFSPYRSGGYSTFFGRTRLNNPSGDPTEAITATLGSAIGTGDFSFSYWVYVEDPSTGPHPKRHFDLGGSGIRFYQHSNTTMRLQIGGGTILDYATLGSLSIKSWHYVSVTRSSGTVAVHFDGILAGSTTNSTDITQTNFRLGAGTTNDITFGLIGYVRDFMVKNVAVYSITENYTVPDSAESDSDTLILLCSLPYHADGSSNDLTLDLYPVHNNVAMTAAPEIHSFSPYDYTEYSATERGGSVYHEGNAGYSDYLETNYTAIGTNNFTLQFWVYPKTTSDIYAGYFSSKKSTSITGITVAKDTIDIGTNTSSIAAFGNPSIKEESWSHIAVVRSSDISTAYVNGKSLGSISGTGSFDIQSDVFRTMQRYGYNQGSGWAGKGYISDLKLSQTVDYTAEFTPPTTPLSSTNAEFHIKGTDASIIDKSQINNLKLFGNTTGSTAQAKFVGSKSMYFDGSGDYIITPQQELGTEDFTIEGWHYLLTRANTKNGIFGNYTSYSAGSLGMFAGHSSGTTTSYQVAYNGDTFPANVIQGGTIAYNQWVHFAVVRNSGTMNLYINGTSVDSISATASLNGVGSNLIVGAPGDNLADGMHGYLEDFRITKGLARYTTNFTPPTEPLEG